jgi:hypothetical protein
MGRETFSPPYGFKRGGGFTTPGAKASAATRYLEEVLITHVGV